MAPEIESDACASNSFTSDESEDEFEVPEGFHSIKASKSLLHEDIHSDDKELWLFKLPKNMSASSLSNQSIHLGKRSRSTGRAVATIQHNDESYIVRTELNELSKQITNAFPTAENREKLILGKPFTTFLSIVQDCENFQDTKVTKLMKKKKQKLDDQRPRKVVA